MSVGAGERWCDLSIDGKPCMGHASHYGQTRDGEIADLCPTHFLDYARSVAKGINKRPHMTCSRCGKIVEMDPRQYSTNIFHMDNRIRQRPFGARFNCKECNSGLLSWATTSTGFVVFKDKFKGLVIV